MVRVVDHGSDRRVLEVANRRKHVLNRARENRKRFHEGDDTFTFLDLNFCFLNTADLFLDKAAKESGDAVMYLGEGQSDKLLICFFVLV